MHAYNCIVKSLVSSDELLRFWFEKKIMQQWNKSHAENILSCRSIYNVNKQF